VVSSAVLGSLIMLALAGWFLVNRVTQGVVTAAQESSLIEANEALSGVEDQMRALGYDYASSDAIDQIARQAISAGESSGRYHVKVMTATGTLQAPGFDGQAVSDELVAAAVEQPGLVHSTPCQVHLRSGQVSPGLAVASTVSGGGLDRFAIFLVFDFADDAKTLATVQTGVALSGGVMLLGIGLVSYFVARQTLAPVRLARKAAERLAAGELTQLMPVRGTDDLAQLAVSMNHMANQLQQRIRQLEQLSRVQQRFVSDVSHELRTPLATVRMAADLLYDRRSALPAADQRPVELLNHELNRFQALLADLLEISRFDAGAASLVRETTDLHQLITEEIEALADLTASTGSQIVLSGDDQAIASIDPRRIARLVRNLLSNAIEHGEGRPIDIILADDDQVVAFAVRDHGVGFSLEQGRQLFNRFWRSDPARARHIGGTGLGLSISQEDVRLHQGWIHAWGRPAQGAQFRVVLPRDADCVVTYSPIPLVPTDAFKPEEDES
jgi:two-component system sensor histidine kinase MtrB